MKPITYSPEEEMWLELTESDVIVADIHLRPFKNRQVIYMDARAEGVTTRVIHYGLNGVRAYNIVFLFWAATSKRKRMTARLYAPTTMEQQGCPDENPKSKTIGAHHVNRMMSTT